MTLQAAYVLHSRPYRESSAIVEFITQQQGRISLVAKGIQSAKSPLKGVLQPFQPLLLSFKGKGELKNLVHAELALPPVLPKGESLYAGFYINELLMRLLAKEIDAPELFQLYRQTLTQLISIERQQLEPLLRSFELTLLDELGYGIDFTEVCQESNKHLFYRYIPQQGFVFSGAIQQPNTFSGETLNNIVTMDFSEKPTRLAAKYLMRAALAPHIGNKPLASRELFSKRESYE